MFVYVVFSYVLSECVCVRVCVCVFLCDAATALVMILTCAPTQFGDNTNFVVSFAGELLNQARALSCRDLL